MRRDPEQFRALIESKKTEYYKKRAVKRKRLAAAAGTVSLCTVMAIVLWPSAISENPNNSELYKSDSPQVNDQKAQTYYFGLASVPECVTKCSESRLALIERPSESTVLLSSEVGSGSELSELKQWLTGLKLENRCVAPFKSVSAYRLTLSGDYEIVLYVSDGYIYNDSGDCYRLSESEISKFSDIVA